MVHLVGRDVGKVGYGLMGLTWRPKPQPAEASFEAMRTALSQGATFWNGGELYGPPDANSLQLLHKYFTKYPEDADKVVLSIKGGLKKGGLEPDGSRENVRRSIDECLKWLGKKKLDLFECARVDRNTPIEDTISYIAEYVKDGKLGGISLSEVNANTIRRAAKVHKISAVEVEFSLFSTNILENGIAKTCAELNIPIVAYSPLGRGFLTGQIRKYEDIPEDSHLRHFPRFQPEHFDDNIKLVRKVEEIASNKGSTVGQIAIAWVVAHSGRNGLGEIIPIPGATTPERVKENTQLPELSEDEFNALNEFLKGFEVKGGRYPAAGSSLLEG